MFVKYTKLRDQVREQKNFQSQQEPEVDAKQIETLRDIINGIDEQYFSDL